MDLSNNFYDNNNDIEWEEIPLDKVDQMLLITDLATGEPLYDYELKMDLPAIIKHFIDTSVEDYELEVIIGQCVMRLNVLSAERKNVGRSSEWDVLGDK